MPIAGVARGFDSHFDRGQIDIVELFCFCRTRMRDTDEMDERVATPGMFGVGIHSKRVAHNTYGPGGQFVFGTGANQRLDAVAAFCEDRNQSTADVACATGYENGIGHSISV